jgi:hypothetical protein
MNLKQESLNFQTEFDIDDQVDDVRDGDAESLFFTWL